MRRIVFAVAVVVCSIATPAAAQLQDRVRPFDAAQGRPIVVQGAMPIEVQKLVSRLDNATQEQVGGWTFWRGTVNGYPVIVSKTLKGIANAAAATVLAVERYHPIAIVNQGTSGGHDPSLHLYDIVIGTSSVSLGAFRTPYRAKGAGSQPLEWMPLNLTATEGSAGNDPKARTVARFHGDVPLIAAARSVKEQYTRGRVVEGVIGSSDMWIDEVDLVARFNREYSTMVEEMETASAAQVAGLLNTPFLGIRVVSDNVTNGTAYDPKTSEACADFVYEVVKAYVGTLKLVAR